MKKNQKLKTIIGSFLMMVFVSLILFPTGSALASSDEFWDSYEMPSTRQKERLLDAADLLSDSEEADLLQRLNSISETHKSNVVILTVNEHTGPVQDFADDYFDYNGFQADYYTSGILFMLSMEDREWAISTHGSAAEAFTDYGQEYLMDQMLPYLSDGDYYRAFSEYINVADRFFTLYEQGTPYDVNNTRAPKNPLAGAAVSILIGIVVALAVVAFMARDLHTVHMNASAAGYQSHSGIKMKVHHDTYVRTTTARTKLPEHDNNSRGGHSGGSTMHTSSSGSSHGGSHGHF